MERLGIWHNCPCNLSWCTYIIVSVPHYCIPIASEKFLFWWDILNFLPVYLKSVLLSALRVCWDQYQSALGKFVLESYWNIVLCLLLCCCFRALNCRLLINNHVIIQQVSFPLSPYFFHILGFVALLSAFIDFLAVFLGALVSESTLPCYLQTKRDFWYNGSYIIWRGYRLKFRNNSRY